jgi:archaetidylinositol phosphate synthase
MFVLPPFTAKRAFRLLCYFAPHLRIDKVNSGFRHSIRDFDEECLLALVLTRFRQSIRPAADRLGRALGAVLPYPTAWTAFGAVLAALAGLAYYRGSALTAGLLILVSGFMDAVDGAVARSTGKVSLRGGFIDSNLDRLGEVFLFAGIAGSGLMDPVLPLLALSFSLLVSYSRARAEGLGLKAEGVGVGERAERLLALAIASVVDLTLYGVLLVFALALVTFVQRLWAYYSQL